MDNYKKMKEKNEKNSKINDDNFNLEGGTMDSMAETENPTIEGPISFA